MTQDAHKPKPLTESPEAASARRAERRWTERRQRRVLRLRPERRSGFERRREPRGPLRTILEDALLYMYEHPFWVAAALLTLNFLNLLDAVLTVRALQAGSREANPLMAALFAAGTGRALAFKLSLVAALSALLWGMRHFRVALVAALAAAGAYVLVAAYHATLIVLR